MASLAPKIMTLRNSIQRQNAKINEEDIKIIKNLITKWEQNTITEEEKGQLIEWYNYIIKYKEWEIKQKKNSPVSSTSSDPSVSSTSSDPSVSSTSSDPSNMKVQYANFYKSKSRNNNIKKLQESISTKDTINKYKYTTTEINKVKELLKKYENKTLTGTDIQSFIQYLNAILMINQKIKTPQEFLFDPKTNEKINRLRVLTTNTTQKNKYKYSNSEINKIKSLLNIYNKTNIQSMPTQNALELLDKINEYNTAENYFKANPNMIGTVQDVTTKTNNASFVANDPTALVGGRRKTRKQSKRASKKTRKHRKHRKVTRRA